MKSPENMNEFEWEVMLRESDEKIHDYMKKLPHYIHVPGEYNITFANLKKNESALFSEFNDDDNEDNPSVSWRESEDAPVLEKLLLISRHWMMINSAVLSGEDRKLAFQALSDFGIATGQLIAVLETAQEMPGFAIAGLKRSRRKISHAEATLRKISKNRPELKNIIKEQVSELCEISSKLTDKILSLQKKVGK